ncbi:MAG: HD domain-containing protein [Desulfobacterales bacterium]|nr:MAG: HD domain-containing protein [Desulfobacterales bacterium]
MKNIANLLFEANMLKEIPRSGYHFLGTGRESVAEHTYNTTFIAFIMSKLDPSVDALKLITMCLVHDLPESRIGDLNTIQKKYVSVDESKAVEDTINNLPFGSSLAHLIHEFNEGRSAEAKFAYDADQLALILELKCLSDIGYQPPNDWLPHVLKRLKTKLGKKIAQGIMETNRDEWWLNNWVDSPKKKK